MPNKNLFKISEFANLCGITRDTLLHYDKKDLLKPKYQAANGYRMYGAEQYFEFELIALLKQTGMSLEEIKTYRMSCSDTEYLNIIKRQVDKFERQYLRIKQKIDSMKFLLNLADDIALKAFDSVFFEQRNPEQMEIYPLKIKDAGDPKNHIASYSKYFLAHNGNKQAMQSPLGTVISAKQVLAGRFNILGFFSSASSKELHLAPLCHIKIKPGGRYACIIHKGEFSSHRQACFKLLQECEALGAVTEGEIWSLDLISYLLNRKAGNVYTARYEVKVRS